MNRKSEMGQNPNNEESKRKKDHIIFLICVLLAGLFWVLIKLSGNYSVSYPMQIHYENAPENMMITALQDSSITISFKSDGYNILELLIAGKLKTINADLAKCPIHKIDRLQYSIPSQSLKDGLAFRLGIQESDLIFSKTELTFQMETLDKKNLTVSPVLNLTFKSQHGLYRVKTIPKTVQVFGPQNLIDSLKSLKTESIILNDLASQQEVNTQIQNPFPHQIKIVPKRVKVQIEVEKFTESSLVVPIDVSNINPILRTFPTSTTLYFNIFLRDYNKIRINQFRVVPDVKNIKLKIVKKLSLKIVNSPKEISNVRMNPTEVEFIIVN